MSCQRTSTSFVSFMHTWSSVSISDLCAPNAQFAKPFQFAQAYTAVTVKPSQSGRLLKVGVAVLIVGAALLLFGAIGAFYFWNANDKHVRAFFLKKTKAVLVSFCLLSSSGYTAAEHWNTEAPVFLQGGLPEAPGSRGVPNLERLVHNWLAHHIHWPINTAS